MYIYMGERESFVIGRAVKSTRQMARKSENWARGRVQIFEGILILSTRG